MKNSGTVFCIIIKICQVNSEIKFFLNVRLFFRQKVFRKVILDEKYLLLMLKYLSLKQNKTTNKQKTKTNTSEHPNQIMIKKSSLQIVVSMMPSIKKSEVVGL